MTTATVARPVRETERESIRRFVESCSSHFTADVLDYGCGSQPYRDVIEGAGGNYHGYDRQGFPANVSGRDVGADELRLRSYDAILCTQVAQYWPDPIAELSWLRSRLNIPGVLVITWPLCWDFVEADDLWRFTPTGMHNLLKGVGFKVARLDERASCMSGEFRFPLGYGAIAR